MQAATAQLFNDGMSEFEDMLKGWTPPDQPGLPCMTREGAAPVFVSANDLETSFSISSTFDWDLLDADGTRGDFNIITSDGVHFLVHSAKLHSSSANNFCGLLLSNGTACAYLSSTILNLLLHIIYDISPARYAPSINDIATTVNALESYGLSKTELITPTSLLFKLIFKHAPSQPLACYILAAQAELEDLAVSVSPYTLSLALPELSDEDVMAIGPHYLRRLFFLHLGRVDALKRALFPPPDLHLATNHCTLAMQRTLSRAWTIEVAKMSWNLSPDISVTALEAQLRVIEDDLSCPECQKTLGHRLKRLLVEWSLVKRSI